MIVRHLTLRRFRNIEDLAWEPAPGLNLIWGANGQGKTNLLEGLHLALTGRSFRTRHDEQCLPWGQCADLGEPTLAEATLARRAGERRLRLLLGRDWKRAFADGQWLARLADLWRETSLVTFTPESAALFKGPPAERRRFLDAVLCHLSPPYLEALQRYTQALRQFNAALKSEPRLRDVRPEVRPWHPLLAAAGVELMRARAACIAGGAASLSRRYAQLGGTGDLDWAYDANMKRLLPETPPDAADTLASLHAAYVERLEAGYDEGRRMGTCPLGPHRDDFAMRLAGRDLRRYGSQGQHRLAALALTLEAAQWLEAARGEAPILLLDDFGSELDPVRRRAVLEGLKGRMQVFLTATDPDDLGGAELFDDVRRVEGGRLSDRA